MKVTGLCVYYKQLFIVYYTQMCSCLCFFFDFRFIFVIIKYSPVLFNNFASGAADIGDQLVFRCSRPVFKLSGEINLSQEHQVMLPKKVL